MSYEVKVHGRMGAALQRLAEEELAIARRHVGALRDEDVAQAAHEARKHFKKLRALLRMLREPLGKRVFSVETVCYRNAGRCLRELRDTHVMVQQLDTLRERFYDDKRPAFLSQARRRLVAAEQHCRRQLTGGEAIPLLLQELEVAAGRIGQWKLDQFGWKEALHAIQLSYQRARRAFKEAVEHPRSKHLHEWRKRTKELWYHTRLLRRASPTFMEEFAHDLEVLSHFAGEDRDLALLREALTEPYKAIKQPRQLETVGKMIDLRRHELVCAAFDLGERVFSDTPDDFARELDRKRDARRKVVRKTKKLLPEIRASH